MPASRAAVTVSALRSWSVSVWKSAPCSSSKWLTPPLSFSYSPSFHSLKMGQRIQQWATQTMALVELRFKLQKTHSRQVSKHAF